MNRQRVFALLGVAFALFALYRATRRLESAAEEVERRGWTMDVVMSALVAVAAVILAAKKSSDATSKVSEAFESERSG
jgi:predicted Co/Zn/Cd cation transporter (cation efflux family)